MTGDAATDLTPHPASLVTHPSLPIRALLFAAGASVRMGTPKPLLPWGGETLIEYQVHQLRAAGALDVVAVVGHAADRVRPLVEAAGGRVILNPAYRTGRASSVRAGALSLPDQTSAVIVLSVDQPRAAPLIARIVVAHLLGGAAITTPEQEGRRGHPIVLDGSLLPELRTVTEEREGLRAIVRQNNDRRCILPIDDPAIHLEFNTPTEYAAALAASEAHR